MDKASQTRDLVNEVLIQGNYLSPEQIDRCRRDHEEAARLGVRISFLKFLQDKGLIDAAKSADIQKELMRRGMRPKLGEYEILEKLGEGGMGSVYKARHPRLNSIVAIKVLLPEIARDKSLAERFMREARLAAQLQDADIVQVLDMDQADGKQFIVMQFVDGESLQGRIDREGKLPETDALRIVRDVARTLAIAHRQGIVHRDIKPSNIMLTRAGRVKVCDLGLAKSVERDGPALTESGTAMGTPHYIAPEQARNTKTVDGRADIYSLGATLFHMATGTTPYKGSSSYEIILKHATEPTPDPRAVNPALSPAAAILIQRMMMKDPAGRFATCEEVVREIDGILSAATDSRAGIRTVVTPPDGVPAQAGAEAADGVAVSGEKRKWLVLGGAGLGVALLAVFAVWAGSERGKNASGGPPLTTTAKTTSTTTAAAPTTSLPHPPPATVSVADDLKQYHAARAQHDQLQSELTQQRQHYNETSPVIRTLLEKTETARVEMEKRRQTAIAARMPRLLALQRQREEMAREMLPAHPKRVEIEGQIETTASELAGIVDNPHGLSAHQFARALAAGVPPTLTLDLGGGVNMKLVYIPPGEFLMGSPENEVGRRGDEPQHRVRITKGFYMGVTEVTQTQYQTLMGNNPTAWHKGPELPVESVSWDNAVEFCKRLSARTGREVRLPTEAEWEYACRAGTTTRYFFGHAEDALGDYAWFGSTGTTGTRPVGQKRPNPWGLYDMYGNVYDWCQDWYDGGYYAKSPASDPTGPAAGQIIGPAAPPAPARVVRGGSSNMTNPADFRSATRDPTYPDRPTHCNGIRVVCSVRPPPSRSAEEPKPPSVPTAPATQDGAQALPPALPLTLDLGGGVTMELARISPGEFMMGSPDNELARAPDEGPQHRVRITRAFYMGVTEVTQAQYQAVMGKNPSKFKYDQNPVEMVPWSAAVEFCKRLSARTGREVRLPTEAEWEYACRAGTTTRFFFGERDGDLGDYAWCAANSGRMTRPVGQKRPNPWGLHDMAGNVLEWCMDWHARGYYNQSPYADPPGPETGDLCSDGGRNPPEPTRVARGGSWLSSEPRYLRSAARERTYPETPGAESGFRVVCNVP